MSNSANLNSTSLNGTWKMLDVDPGEGEKKDFFTVKINDAHWLPAEVPGDVHTSLLALGRIPDPFVGSNVDEVQWIEAREWWFRRSFTATPTREGERAFLTFDGLDLFATVYLNGTKLGEHANMFRPAEFEVTDRLKEENVIAVRFDPMRSRVSDLKLPVQMPHYDPHTRAQVRKTQAQFMWDHTPTCIMVGLWQRVSLSRFEGARLHPPHFRVLSLDEEQAVVSVDAEVERWGEGGLELNVSLTPQTAFAKGETRTHQTSTEVKNGRGRVVLTIENPALWWPNGLGEAALYDLHVTLTKGGQTLDTFNDEVGLRTVRVDRSQDPLELGRENFTFVVNDVPVFINGANWVPTDLLNGRVKPEDYEDAFSLMKESYGNMMRVWGGGQYEPDAFYKTADRLGILVWHDFMFACATYPDHLPGFVEEVRLEAEFQVTRLRNRPCMAIWVGNNENDWHLDRIQWKRPGAPFPGKMLAHDLLPNTVHRLDPDRFYWPSSPYGGDDHNSDRAGDKHNWQTWHALGARTFGDPPAGDVDLAVTAEAVNYWHLGTDVGRFISEYGMHAAPVRETFERNLPAEALTYKSPETEFRIRNVISGRGDLLMEAHTGLPSSFDEYIDFSMMAQAEGLKHAIEHYRRRKFHCSGQMFWQWNDNWPSTTWSVLDYYRFPKAGYFFAKRAQAPVMVSVKREGEQYAIWGSNATLADVEETLTWRYATFDGEVKAQDSLSVRVPANASCPLVKLDDAIFVNAEPAKEML